MKLNKPKFWDYKKPSIISYILWPISVIIQIIHFLRSIIQHKKKNSLIKTICVGNIYLGGTGKTSLSLKIQKILEEKKIKTCFIKKYYPNQIDEQKILEENGKLFTASNRQTALNEAIKQDYQIAIFDDGLQDFSINYDLSFVCFNNINWIGNGFTIPAGPLRENPNNLRKYKNLFLNGNNENLKNIKEYIFRINPTINIYEGRYVALNVNEFDRKNKYLAFSGIGNHKTFISMLKTNKFDIIKELEFPDHYSYSNDDIEKIISFSKKSNCKIITTEKDYNRLDQNLNKEIKFIKSELEIVNEKDFLNNLLKLYG